MTTQRQMEMVYVAQQEVIALLRHDRDDDLALRLERCMVARRQRYFGDGWPWTCRSAACVWCRRPMIRAWWKGVCDWSAEASESSLAIIRLEPSSAWPDAVRRLRRGLRDVRDRTARQRRAWRDLTFAGMAGADRTAWIMIAHDGVDQDEVQDALRRRWPRVVVKGLAAQEVPQHAVTVEDAVQLGRCRRGIEPLRIVIMPQRAALPAPPSIIKPMPVLV